MVITESAIREALRQVIDPELGINIVDLGLVYAIEIDGTRVRVRMTMTSPACSLGEYLKDLADSMIKWRVRGVEAVDIVLVWEPPWNPDLLSERAKQQLNGGV